MKARWLPLGGAALGLVALILAFVLVLSHPAVSFRLVRYQHWPHGAIVRLTNNSRAPIRYVAERSDTPAGDPVLCLEKTADGWTNKSPLVLTAVAPDPRLGKTVRIFFSAQRLSNAGVSSSAMSKGLPAPGQYLDFLVERELGPGHSADFFVRVEPGAAPKKVGTIYIPTQSELAKVLDPWLVRIRTWLHLSPGLNGGMEIWCSTALQLLSASDTGQLDKDQ